MDSSKSESSGTPGPSTARTQRERELERKRARGEASCAECRRLKLKCDKKSPCSSCVRRGCSTICPNGSLATGQGTRYVLANTDKLHGKLLEMSRRIRQLEDALQIAQLCISSTQHPLLSPELLAIKTNIDVVEETAESEVADTEIFPNIGTLTITEHGETRFLGRTGSEMIMHAVVRDSSDLRKRMLSSLPAEVAYLTETFPFAPAYLPRRQILEQITARLPTYERATALVEAYLAHLSCFFRPVQREQITEELLPRYYRNQEAARAEDESGIAVHQLALLLAVFAAGAAGDLTQDSHNEEGELYRHLTRCALSLHSIFEGTSLATVQALSLIGSYDFYSASTQTTETAWKMLSLSLCLASSIGLHWDPSSWGITGKYAQRRRNVFWELYSLDNWKSLGSGRPPVFRLHEVDCRYPDDREEIIGKDGSTLHGFWYWRHDYAKHVIAVISSKLCTVQPLKYSEVLELDRRVRDYSGLSNELLEALSSGETADIFKSLMTTLYKEISLIFVHRNFFVRALRESPSSPIRSRFGPSFLAAYASAITILRSMRRNFESCYRVLQRMWPLWAHTFASGVIVGSVAARDTSELAQAALKELELAIVLFERASDHPISKNGLPILLRLRDKARSNFASSDVPLTSIATPEASSTPTSTGVTVKEEPIDEALSMLGGETRFVKKKKEPVAGSSSEAADCSSDATRTPSLLDTTMQVARNAPLDANGLLEQPTSQNEPASTLNPASGDFYTWLYGRNVERANAEDSYNHNQITFANDLASSIVDPCGMSGVAQTQQQQQEGANNLVADDLAFWGFQNAFNLQSTQQTSNNILTGSTQSGDRGLNVISDPSALYANTANSSDPVPGSSSVESNARSMVVDGPVDYDFDVGGGMVWHGEPGTYAGPGSEDATIEDAWRFILEDSQFSTSDPFL